MSLCRSEKSCRKELSECAMVARQGGGLRNLRRGSLKGGADDRWWPRTGWRVCPVGSLCDAARLMLTCLRGTFSPPMLELLCVV